MTGQQNRQHHLAIIMDGNGRWATERKHSRVWGHIRGTKVVSKIIETAYNESIAALTLYAFSNENWSRPLREVKTLFSLLNKFILLEKKRIIRNRIRFKVIGDISGLPDKTKALIQELEEKSRDFKELKLNIAFGYSGRHEIIDAANSFFKKNPGQSLTSDALQSELYSPDLADVDLVIRTGGEQRLSNFLLWQSAYAELHFTLTKWPDFSSQEFLAIYQKFKRATRRFGNIDSQQGLKDNLVKASQNKDYFRQQAD